MHAHVKSLNVKRTLWFDVEQFISENWMEWLQNALAGATTQQSLQSAQWGR